MASMRMGREREWLVAARAAAHMPALGALTSVPRDPGQRLRDQTSSNHPLGIPLGWRCSLALRLLLLVPTAATVVPASLHL